MFVTEDLPNLEFLYYLGGVPVKKNTLKYHIY